MHLERAATDADLAWRDRWATDPVAAMTSVVREHRSAIYARARGICGGDLAADVAQEVFLRLWQDPLRYRPSRGPLGPFLLMMAGGVAVDLLRGDARRRRRDERVLGGNRPAVDCTDDLADPVASERVRLALVNLQPAQREVLIAAFCDGLRRSEISIDQRVPEGTVKSRIRLGLQHMREQLDDLRQDPNPAGVSRSSPAR